MDLPRLMTIVTAFKEAGIRLDSWLQDLGIQTGPGGCPFQITKDASLGEGFVIQVAENGIIIQAGSPRGAVYALYAFLETVLGCRFLAADCVVLPPSPVKMKAGEFRSSPAFSCRELYWRGALPMEFALQLRLNASRGGLPDGLAAGLRFFNYSHSFDTLVDPEVWFDSHPEYFSQVGGLRQKENSQLCLSNPEVLALVVAKVRSWMRENPDCSIFSVSMNDWYAPCECDGCAAIDAREGSQSGSLIAFINQVADAVKGEFPDKFIHTFAYLYARKPPKTLRARDNVIIRLCPIERCFSHGLGDCGAEARLIDVKAAKTAPFQEGGSFRQDLKGWARTCKHLYIWDYTTNYANYLQPFPNLACLQKTLLWYRDQGVQGVFLQGNYSPGQASAFAALKVYVMARLLWNPEADLDHMTAQFVEGYYGRAAAPLVMAYLALSHQAVQGHHMSLYDGPDAPYFAGGWLQEGVELLNQALLLTRDAKQRERIERELLSPRYALLAAQPLNQPGREASLAAFEADCRRLGISELFERRELQASFDCLRSSPCARDRASVPYIFYRL